MEWLTCLKRTLEYIEDNLRSDIDIAAVSANVYVSQYYLQKGFQVITGTTIGEYIRSRRLYEAALDITRTDDKIIEIALRYGYETPESFSKAFARFHGSTPSAVRKDPGLIRCYLPLNISIDITGGDRMDYVVSPMWGFKVIGFERVFKDYESMDGIPQFWDEICEKYCSHTIYAGLPPACPQEQAIMDNCIGEYGVCIHDIGDGSFRYIIAGRYTGGDVPDGMTLYEIPQGEWAKFKATGPVPEAIQSLNGRIFREWLPGNPEYELAGKYSIEWYSCDGYKTDADYQSGVWIPVRRYQQEAQQRWGETEQYKEYAKRAENRTQGENDAISDGLMQIFARFGGIKDSDPDTAQAMQLVAELRDYISDNYYNCSNVILRSLGEMYTGDERFRSNIDKTGGEGTAEFAAKAIALFCEKE